MPPGKASALEVVEAELALEVFANAFGSPALHDDADELLSAEAGRQRREEVVGWLVFAVTPIRSEARAVHARQARSPSPSQRRGSARRCCKRRWNGALRKLGSATSLRMFVASSVQISQRHHNRARLRAWRHRLSARIAAPSCDGESVACERNCSFMRTELGFY
jgi:hypothetical protein